MSNVTSGLRALAKSDHAFSCAARIPLRFSIALSYAIRPIAAIPHWIIRSRETTNFTYDLTSRNLKHLAATISHVTGCSIADAQGYIEEPLVDTRLNQHIRDTTKLSRLSGTADPSPRFARRLGWYAIARAIKPRVIVETGVDKGLGSVLLCAALLRNSGDGHDGRYIGTDINPEAGYLLANQYAEVGRIAYGDSLGSLEKIAGPVDLFINDSDHSAIYELDEYRTIASKLSAKAIILGDNAHSSDSLFQFAQETDRGFLFFAEQPSGHWYPGAGIGICFPIIAAR